MTRLVAFMRDLVSKGMTWEDAAIFAERFEEEVQARVAQQLEALAPKRSASAERQASYRERKRSSKHNAEHNAEHNDVTDTVIDSVDNANDATLSLPLSPQTPQTPTHTRVSVNTREGEREAEAFDRFWMVYPRKVAKADARKAYHAAWKKLPPHDEEAVIIGGLERAMAGWTDAQFIPHAATWLRGDRWNDEPPSTVIPIRGPHDRPHDDKFTRKQANLARALAASHQVAGFRGKP